MSFKIGTNKNRVGNECTNVKGSLAQSSQSIKDVPLTIYTPIHLNLPQQQ
jgi:hypothetical protein